MLRPDQPLMIKDAAPIVGCGSRTLFKRLRDAGALNDQNLPKYELVREGLFKTEHRQYRLPGYRIDKWYSVTLITPKGIAWVADLINSTKREELC